MKYTEAQITALFTYHPPNESTQQGFRAIHDAWKEFEAAIGVVDALLIVNAAKPDLFAAVNRACITYVEAVRAWCFYEHDFNRMVDHLRLMRMSMNVGIMAIGHAAYPERDRDMSMLLMLTNSSCALKDKL